MASSLQERAAHTIVKSLGETANSIVSRFCCGGTLNSPEQIKLVYENDCENDDGNWCSVTFPGVQPARLQQLLSVCSVASFGVGGEDVTDKSYRDALKLDPKRFLSSFHPWDVQLLGTVQNLMMPDMCYSQHMRAELYKLNIYSGPGAHFKAHVDTPQSGDMFGSLVVCLPTQFTGGELVTRHQGQEIRFDWSSSPDNPMKKVSWAAFFSDVEHEVLPVTNGHRLTLTYNLYCDHKLARDVAPTVSITCSPFYHELRAAVSNPHFMRDGGVLGFSCQHQYVFQDLNSSDDLPCLLKGADNVVYMSGRSLGLQVSVKPVMKSNKPIYTDNFYLGSNFKADHIFRVDNSCIDPYDECMEDVMKKLLKDEVETDDSITWCKKARKFKPVGAYIAYGNEPSCGVIYQAASILVHIPAWSDSRHALGAADSRDNTLDETMEPSRKKMKSELNVDPSH